MFETRHLCRRAAVLAALILAAAPGPVHAMAPHFDGPIRGFYQHQPRQAEVDARAEALGRALPLLRSHEQDRTLAMLFEQLTGTPHLGRAAR